jgi:hypothetical protein
MRQQDRITLAEQIRRESAIAQNYLTETVRSPVTFESLRNQSLHVHVFVDRLSETLAQLNAVDVEAILRDSRLTPALETYIRYQSDPS